jgi:glycosyltransferase involved in cell wall biosynthesis
MKIILVNKYLYPKGGAEVATLMTSELLKSHGHEVFLWGMDHPENPDYPLKKYFVSNIDYYARYSLLKKIAIAVKILYSFEAKKKFGKVLDLVKPDIVHLNNIAHQISPSILIPIKKRKIPVVMTLHDYKLVCPVYTLLRNGKPCELCRHKRYYHCVLNKCSKNSYAKSLVSAIEMYLHHTILDIYRKIDCFIAPSEFLRIKISEMGFSAKIIHIPNYLFINGFHPENSITHMKTILYVGRLSYEKGVTLLLQAMNDVDANLIIIGDGPIRKELEDYVQVSGLKSRVSFLGYVNHIVLVGVMRSAFFAVCPSLCYEVFSLFSIEAFAMQLPVVGARIGGIPELVIDGITGLTFTPGNADDLREKILYLLDHPEQVKKMGQTARLRVEKRYTSEMHYQRLVGVYNNLISR